MTEFITIVLFADVKRAKRILYQQDSDFEMVNVNTFNIPDPNEWKDAMEAWEAAGIEIA